MNQPTLFEGTPIEAALREMFDAVVDDETLALIGGREALEDGLAELASAMLPLAAEIVAETHKGQRIADIVLDPDNALHATKVHGFFENLLTMAVPAELLPWAKRLVRLPPPPTHEVLRQEAVIAATHHNNPMFGALARLFVFEAICLIQRLLLLDRGVQLEALGGHRTDIEEIAQAELDALEHEPYSTALLELDQPLDLVQCCGVVGLSRHVETLRLELATLSDELREVVEERRKIVELAERLDGGDAVILRNEMAPWLGEERVSARRLKLSNPGHLGRLSEDGVYKRKERLPARVTTAPPMRTTTSLADLILSAATENEEVN